jgi:hypothetical protein
VDRGVGYRVGYRSDTVYRVGYRIRPRIGRSYDALFVASRVSRRGIVRSAGTIPRLRLAICRESRPVLFELAAARPLPSALHPR